MKMKLLLVISSLLISQVLAVWESLYSPLHRKAYLKLSTDEILSIDYQQAEFNHGDTIDDIIDPPTTSNYSIVLADGVLYAFYANEDDDDLLEISRLDTTTNDWDIVKYNTTLTDNLQYYTESSFIASLPSSGDSNEAIYIYGGKYNNSISNRLLEFNPTKKTLNSIVTSISPTAFYGGSSGNIDSDGKSSVVIGGKASSGWVSMFQIAVWEYRSWSFKTVSSSDFGVNSRINPLVLPVYNDDSEVSSLLVLGGYLGASLSSPYVLNLNITDTWSWSNLTNVGDFKISNCIGGIVLNNTLISIASDSNSKDKRSDSYTLELYDVDSMDQVQELVFSVQATTKSTSILASSSESSSESSSLSGSTTSLSETQSTGVAQTSSIAASSTIAAGSQAHSSSSKTIIIAVVVPVVSILLCVILWFIYKKLKKRDISIESDSESTNTEEYYKHLSDFVDNQSISSWTQKRAEYDQRQSSRTQPSAQPTKSFRKSTEFSFEMSPASQFKKNFKSIYKPQLSVPQRTAGPFADPEDMEDQTRLEHIKTSSPSGFTQQSNKSRGSFNSTAVSSPSSEDYEEQQIEEMLQNRDVQVLVSSKRRSKLRITNPDLESLQSVPETSSSLSSSSDHRVTSNGSGSISSSTDISNDVHLEKNELQLGDDIEFIDNAEDGAYFKEVMRFFDDEENR